MKYILTIILSLATLVSVARPQPIDTLQIIDLYDRCLDFDENKMDSLHYYAELIRKESEKLNFASGLVFYHRLQGIVFDMQRRYEDALEHFLISLSLSKKNNSTNYISAAYTDIAITYGNIKQYDKAKENFLIALEYHKQTKSISGIVNCLANIGTAYFRLNQLDSSEYYLSESLKIGKPYDNVLNITPTYNNLGNLYYEQKKYDLALEHFRYALKTPQAANNPSAQWLSHLNMGYVFLEKKKYDSLSYHIREAEKLAEILESKSKTADIFALKAKYAAKIGEFKKAYEFQEKWYEYDTASIRIETQNTILELQDKYNINEKIAENKLLQEKIDAESFKNRTFIIYMIGLGILILVILKAFIDKRKSNRELQHNNEQMIKKNDQLATLNRQKNDLIGMVSHDLKTPFISIGMWSQILNTDESNLTEDQKTAIKKIQQSCNYGEQLIQRILDIEKSTSGSTVNLEEISLLNLVNQISENYTNKLQQKSLTLDIKVDPTDLTMISDTQILSRILENLLSNAIKFSYENGTIQIKVSEVAGMIEFVIHDNGVGIEPSRIATLFNKYNDKSSLGTKGEEGNGLGLTIVKRLVEELGGAITCQSAVNQGTSFIFILRK